VGLLADGWATIPAAPAPAPFPDEAAMRGHTVLALPLGDFQDLGPQFRAVVGGWRSVNGYSGYEPKHYEALRQAARLEVDGFFEPFRARGDLFVVVNVDQPRLIALVERQPAAATRAARARAGHRGARPHCARERLVPVGRGGDRRRPGYAMGVRSPGGA
jgi:hypothetical protein